MVKAAIVLLLTASVVSVGAVRLRVGFSNSPPMAYERSDGTAAGFAIEVLNEAARREGLVLTWQQMPPGQPSEDVLRQHNVDLLPYLFDTPEHRQEFYISTPWWTPEWTIVVPYTSDITDERMLERHRLLVAGPDAALPFFRMRFPQAQISAHDAPGPVLTALCEGHIPAAAFTRLQLNALLLLHLERCNGVRLREIPTAVAADLSMAARPEVRDYAKRLRARIDELTIDGTLARIAQRNPPVPASIALFEAQNLKDVYERRVWTAAFVCMTFILSLSALFLWRQRRAAVKLSASQARLARAHAIAKLGNWEMDIGNLGNNDRPYYWSDEVYRIFGVDKRTFTPTRDTFLQRLPAEDRERVVSAMREAVAGGKPYEIEHAVLQSDGSVRHVREQAELMRDKAGQVVRVVGTVQDITEHRRLEQQLAQSQKMESVGRLAGGVAHDFNNLLTVISGYVAMLLDDLPPDDERREVLHEIADAADRATALTRQLLTFSRRDMIQPSVISLNDLLRNVEKMLRRLIGEDVALTLSLDPDPLHIHADKSQIEQVVLNLAVNARDAMPNGGTLAIRTTRRVVARTEPNRPLALREGNYVELTVTDTGAGIAPEVLSRIFEPFFTTKERGKGTGLGLSMVYGIVTQSGGAIQVRSRPSLGTTIEVLLPAVESAAAAESQREDAPMRVSGAETILVVEDESGVRIFIREVLRSRGYSVLEAGNGREALRVAKEHAGPIDLLLTDVIMPEMGGVELAQRFAELRPDTVVVHMSGYTDRAMRPDVAEKLLQKPFTPEALLRRISESLPNRRGDSSGPAGN